MLTQWVGRTRWPLRRPTTRPPRLAHIATQAKAGESTVSRVLNNKPIVSDCTRQAVLCAQAPGGVTEDEYIE